MLTNQKTPPNPRFTMAVISDLESKIIRQIEYYFGDYNISRDKFLQEEIKKDEGWIALSGIEGRLELKLPKSIQGGTFTSGTLRLAFKQLVVIAVYKALKDM